MIKYLNKLVLIPVFIISLTISGCTSTTKTETSVKREPVYQFDSDRKSYDTDHIVETKTVETKEEAAECGGILSCTVDGVGYVLALPFKAVGFLIGVIF